MLKNPPPEDVLDTPGQGPRVDMSMTALYGLRMKAGLTQLELAYKAGLTPATVCRVERGHQAPSLKTCYRLASALGVNVAQLIGEPADVRPPRIMRNK
jgi:transcriptional regulator with XRE-family HTH domain